MRIWRLPRAAVTLGLLGLGCSSSTEPAVPRAVEMILGDGQFGTVGESLALPLLVRVTDKRGDGLGAVEVAFSVTSGTGVLNGILESCFPSSAFGNPLATVPVETNADGYAWVSMVPAWFGTTTVSAEVNDVPPVAFTTDVKADVGATVEVADPYEQEVIAGPQRIEDFDILVTDGQGRGVPGVPVTWEITSGGGSMRGDVGCSSERTTLALTTRTSGLDIQEAAGYSQVAFQATAFGVTTVTASVTGLEGSPLTFTVDATKVEIILSQSAEGETRFLGPEYTAEVKVSTGATVEWWNQESSARITSTSAPAGGGSFDSGLLGPGERFQFVPDVAGTWDYVDQVSGAQGTLTVF